MQRRILNPEQIVKKALERMRNSGFGARNNHYETCMAYYEGRQESRGAHRSQAMNQQGRPLIRDMSEFGQAMNQGRTMVANRISPIVDDYQGLLGRWPNVRVPAPDGSPQAEAKAQKETLLLHSTYEMVQMARQQAQAGFQLTCMGDTVYIAEPDWEKKRILPSVVDPRYCFPQFMGGWRRFDLYDLVIAYTLNQEEVEVEYGVKLKNEPDPHHILCVTYLSPFQRTIVVGEKSQLGGEDNPHGIPHTEWDFDFCPAEWVHNKITRNNAYGNSDIAGALAMQDFYNFALSVQADGLVEMTYPIRAVINPVRFGQDQINIGPGETVALEEGGDIKVVAPTPPPTAAGMLIQQVMDDMNAVAGTSSARLSGEQPHSSIATGRSLHAAQGPQGTRIELRQILLGSAISRLSSRLLEMQERAPEFDRWMKDKGVEIAGRYQGQSFRETITSADIDGWYHTTASYDALIGMNEQQKLYVAMQGMAAEIGDDIWAREQMGIEDPQGMRERINTWKLSKAHGEAQAMQIMQPPQPGQQQGPGGPPPQGIPPQGQQGAPPPPIMRPPQLAAQPQPQGVPQGTTLQAVRTALMAVQDQLKGTVWAAGDLALMGQSQAPQILISDFRDHAPVSRALQQVAPRARVRATPEERMPDLRERLV